MNIQVDFNTKHEATCCHFFQVLLESERLNLAVVQFFKTCEAMVTIIEIQHRLHINIYMFICIYI